MNGVSRASPVHAEAGVLVGRLPGGAAGDVMDPSDRSAYLYPATRPDISH